MDTMKDNDYLRAKVAYSMAREHLANEIEMYYHLVDTVGPNLRNSYMTLIGSFEYHLFKLNIDVRRWRRRLELRQKAINAGEQPDLAAIEAQVDAELEKYMEELKAKEIELNEARGRFHCGKMTDSETTELRVAYLDAVKKLHPDLNPDLPEGAKTLWEQILKANKDKNWKQLKFLAGMIDDAIGKKKEYPNTEEGVEMLKAEVVRLKAKYKEVQEEIAALKKEEPFIYEVVLEDSDTVELRQKAIQEDIEKLEAKIAAYEEEWKDGE